MQPLNFAQHTWSTAVFSVAAATLVPVLITLCFAARAFVVVCTVAARPRATDGVDCVVALRVTTRVVDCVLVGGIWVALSLWRAAATVGRVDRAVVADGRVAPNAADAHAKITNAKDKRFKRNPFYLFPVFYHKKVVGASG